ncbi:MAG: immune inhibitor A, partial [Bacteroidetes bacterium]|nr:immune inhibitor A [Bacteroidota bacterium]
MKKFLIYTLTMLLCHVLPLETIAQYQKYSRVKISVDKKHARSLHSLGLSIDHAVIKWSQSSDGSIGAGTRDGKVPPPAGGGFRGAFNAFIITDLSAYEINLLDQNGFTYEILIDDVSKFYQERTKKDYQSKIQDPISNIQDQTCPAPNSNDTITTPNGFSLGSTGGFFTYNEMLAHLDTMAAQYPSLISVKQPIDTFTTIEGRPVFWVKISDNPLADESSTEAQVLYTAIHHAREPVSMSQLIFYMYYLLENYGQDTLVTSIVDRTEMFFVPCVNPDGYIYNETTNPSGGGMWRKNRRNNGDGTFGVDLNRNYGYNWGFDDFGSSPNTISNTYRGTAPFSEPETQAMQYLCEQHNFKIALNYHAFGNMVIYPWGYDYGIYTPDSARFVQYALLLTKNNNYIYGTGDQTVGYIVNGDSDDWMYGEQGTKNMILSMTPEVGSSNDYFWPAPSRIIPLCKDNIFANLYMAMLSGSFVNVEPESGLFISSYNGTIKFDLTSIGLLLPTNVSVSLYSTNPFVTGIDSAKNFTGITDMTPVTDSFSFSLDSLIPQNTEIEFVFMVDDGLNVYEFVVTKLFNNSLPFLSDSLNNLTNWSTANWGITTAQYYSPPSSLTDSPFGNYLPNVNNPVTLNQPVDLTGAVDAYLTFWAKWDIESNWDYLQVKAFNGTIDDPLCGFYTRPGSGFFQPTGEPLYDGIQGLWVQEIMSLNDYLGQTISISFVLNSDGGLEKDGFYFDDFQVFISYPGPVVDLGDTISFCLGDSVTLDAGNPGSTVLWSTGDTTQTIVVDSAGIYSVTVTVSIWSVSDSVVVVSLSTLPAAAFIDSVNGFSASFINISTNAE